MGRSKETDGRSGNDESLSVTADRRVQESLTPTDQKFIESAAGKDTALIKSLKNDILYSKPGSWGSINVNGKLYKLGTQTKGVALDLAQAPKAMKASADLSAAGRQGLITSVNHPVIAAKAFLKQLTMLPPKIGAKRYAEFKRDLDLHPFIELAEDSELHLTSLGDGQMAHREEAFMSQILGDDPYFTNKTLEKGRQALTFPVRASERAYVTFLDYLRINSFAELAKEIHKFNLRTGREDDPKQYEAIAGWINRATGRGDLGRLDNAAPILNATFFSARYWASRLQVLNPRYYAKLPPGARKAAIREMLVFVGAVAGLAALLKAAGFKIEMGDEDNPDLMKLRIGNYSYEFTAGLIGHARYIARMVLAATETDPKGADGKPDKRNAIDKMQYLTGRYVRSKLAPIPSAVVSGTQGQNYGGEPTSYKEEAMDLFKPIMFDNFKDAANADGVNGIIQMAPEFFGISTSRKKSAEEYRKEIDKEKAKPANTPDEKKEQTRRIKLWSGLEKRAAKSARIDLSKANAESPQ